MRQLPHRATHYVYCIVNPKPFTKQARYLRGQRNRGKMIIRIFICCCRCALRCRRESKQSVSTSPQLPTPPHSHRPATSPEVSNDPQSYSYPHVPSNAGRRALSLPTLANPHTNTHSNNTGNVNTRVGNRENGTTQNYSPEPATESSPICIPNPAYTVTNKDGLNNSLASQSESIRVNKWELPSEGATGQRHEYDYPLFKEQEQDTSWDGSDYI